MLTDDEIDVIFDAQYEEYGQVCDRLDMRMFARSVLAAEKAKAEPVERFIPTEEQIAESIRWPLKMADTRKELAQMVADAVLALWPAEADKRVINARNALNSAFHGEGAVIDDLERIVDLVCRQLKRKKVAALAPHKEDGK